jgi:hypothetical protein
VGEWGLPLTPHPLSHSLPPSLPPLAGFLIELWKSRAGTQLVNPVARIGQHPSANQVAKSLAAPRAKVIRKQQHSVPARFELVRKPRYLCDVIRHRDHFTSQPRKHRQVSSRRQVGTQQASPPDLQLDSQKCVEDFYPRRAHCRAELILTGALRENFVPIQCGNPRLAKLIANLRCDFCHTALA